MAGGFGMDDLFIFFGWIFSVGFTVSAWIGCQRFELSRHAWDVKPNLYEGAAMVRSDPSYPSLSFVLS